MENNRRWKGLHVIFLAEKFVAVLSLGFGSSIKIINFIFVTDKENSQAIVLVNIEVSSVPTRTNTTPTWTRKLRLQIAIKVVILRETNSCNKIESWNFNLQYSTMFKSRKLSMLLCNLALFPVGDLLKRCNLNYRKLNKKHFKRAISVVVTYIFISLELIKVKVPMAPNSLI